MRASGLRNPSRTFASALGFGLATFVAGAPLADELHRAAALQGEPDRAPEPDRANALQVEPAPNEPAPVAPTPAPLEPGPAPAPDGAAPPAAPPPAAPPPATPPASPPPSVPPSGAFPLEPVDPTPAPGPAATASPAAPVTGDAPPPVESEPTAAPPPATTDWSVPEGDPERKKDDGQGPLGPLRIGPVVGVGIPNLINFGGTLKITDYIGAGLNIGVIPAIRLSLYGEAVLSYREYDVYARIYPFGGGFYLGAGIGYETVKGSFSDRLDASELAEEYPDLDIPSVIDYESKGRVRTMILTPQLGYFYVSEIGFSIGLFLGAQIPIAPSDIEFETSIKDVPQASIDRYVAPLDEQVRDTLETVARQPLPSLGFQIGWLL